MDPRLAKAAEHWSKPTTNKARRRWWESKLICRDINYRYCGKRVDGTDGGDIELLKQISVGRPLARAVSVGCGNAFHELRLLQAGVVGEFELYELSQSRADEAMEKARAMGVAERVRLHVSDAFAAPPAPTFDLVYWKDALHHMFDAQAAVRWSAQVLKPRGIFFMNEFVGPTHMQYTDRQLELAERARRALPARYLANPDDPSKQVPYRRTRPQLQALLDTDPSECADSANILPALRSTFPNATVIPTGGVVYMLSLNDILANLDEQADEQLLRSMMLADELCAEAGETLYAVAFAFAPD